MSKPTLESQLELLKREATHHGPTDYKHTVHAMVSALIKENSLLKEDAQIQKELLALADARINKLVDAQAAQAAPKAVQPFGYVNTYTGQFFKDVEPCRQNNEGHWRTVYTHPTQQGLEQDAARYQWLKATTNTVTNSDGERIDVRKQPEVWDKAIDAAIATQAKQGAE